MTENNSTKETYDDGIDLNLIFSVLWNHRRLIVFGTLGATLVSIGVSLLLPRLYRSEGYYQLGNPAARIAEKSAKIAEKQKSIGIPVPLYKSSSSQFFNPNRFYKIASQDKSFGEEELKKIKKDFRTAADINQWIKPVYSFAKEDVREFAQLPKDEYNSVIGLNLAYESDLPENAYGYVSFFGKYIRDCLLYVTLSNYIMEEYTTALTKMNKIENDIISSQFELSQNTEKKIDIQSILANYPESAKIESRQLVSVQEGGSRFLSPVTQLVGIESTLADIRRAIAQLEREREKLSIHTEYFSRCFKEMSKKDEHGESLFLLIQLTKDEVFHKKDLNKDEVKEVFNSINIDLQTFDFTFFQNSRFISGPTIPTVPIKPSKTLIVVVTCIASFFFLIVSVLVSHWWQSNKKAIMSDSSL